MQSTTGLPDPTKEPTISVERAGQLLGISRGSAYQAARRGEIPAIRIGRRRVVVPTASLLRLLGVDQ
jgi:excisionase family DNA binding protein